MKSILPKLKKIFQHTKYVVVLPYKNKEHRKVVYKGTHNILIKAIFKYDYDLKDWYPT